MAFQSISAQLRGAAAAPFKYEELFDLHHNEVPTEYRKLSSDGISTCLRAFNHLKVVGIDLKSIKIH